MRQLEPGKRKEHKARKDRAGADPVAGRHTPEVLHRRITAAYNSMDQGRKAQSSVWK